MDLRLNDLVEMKKPHPCGSDRWKIIRTGADVKIKCLGCGRIVMLSRADFVKRSAKLVSSAQTAEAEEEAWSNRKFI